MTLLSAQSDSDSEENTSLSSSEETHFEELAEQDNNIAKKSNVDTVSSWEMRESIEITLTAQPEDTVTAEERLDMPEVF